MSDLLAELRSALHRAPSQEAWAVVCALIERADPVELADRLLPYARGVLSSWPARRCLAPRRWIEQLDRPHTEQWLQIARWLRLGPHTPGGPDAADPGRLDALLDRALSGHLEGMSVEGVTLADQMLRGLWTTDQLPNLRELELRAWLSATLDLSFLGEPCGHTRLRSLELSGNRMSLAHASQLRQSAVVPTLRHVGLNIGGMNAEPILRRASGWPILTTVEELDVSRCPVHRETLVALCRLPALRTLHASGNRLDDGDWDDLRARFPNITIRQHRQPSSLRLRITNTRNGQERTHEAFGEDLCLGRSRSTDIPLPDGTIAPRHLRLRVAPDGAWTAEDLGSTNGTFLNGHFLMRGHPEALREDDTLYCGHFIIHIEQIRTAAPPDRGMEK